MVEGDIVEVEGVVMGTNVSRIVVVVKDRELAAKGEWLWWSM